jgi:hypothetical protein
MMAGACPRCGWPESDPYEQVSRHVTSTGVVTYTRCFCGRLLVRFQSYGGSGQRIVARGA